MDFNSRRFCRGRYKSISVNPARLAYDSAVEKAGKELGLRLKNTSRDSLGREFAGNINWVQALTINLLLGNSTLSLEQFNDFGRLLYGGMKEEFLVYTKAGKQLDSKLLQSYFSDIFEVKSPWRAEYLDATYKMVNEILRMNSHHTINSQRKLTPQISEKLDDDTLMEDRQIDLKYWLDNSTKQGLPRRDVKRKFTLSESKKR